MAIEVNFEAVEFKNNQPPGLDASFLNNLQNKFKTNFDNMVNEVNSFVEKNQKKIDEEIGKLSNITGLPIGGGCDYYGQTPPSGYLFADGSEISRTEYSELFAVIGTLYGAGDGSTTFNLPDKREAVSVMKGDSDTLGSIVGSNTHTLTKAELPNYNLTVTDPGHKHTVRIIMRKASGGTYADNVSENLSTNSQTVTYTSSTTKTGITVNSGGSGTAINIMQKSLVCNYIIKAK